MNIYFKPKHRSALLQTVNCEEVGITTVSQFPQYRRAPKMPPVHQSVLATGCVLASLLYGRKRWQHIVHFYVQSMHTTHTEIKTGDSWESWRSVSLEALSISNGRNSRREISKTAVWPTSAVEWSDARTVRIKQREPQTRGKRAGDY